jgi:hypothetical protein
LENIIVESALTVTFDYGVTSFHHVGFVQISDSSIDNSICLDLSWKIGNVSTQSVAMSKMSVMDVQDMMEDLGDPQSNAPYGMLTGDHQLQPVFSLPQQQNKPPHHPWTLTYYVE